MGDIFFRVIFVMYSTLSPDFLPQIAKADISQEPVEHENIFGKLPHLHNITPQWETIFQKLHQAVIDGLAGGLDDKHIETADGLHDADGALAVGKAGDGAAAHAHAEMLADQLRKLGIRVAGENLDAFSVCNHSFSFSS